MHQAVQIGCRSLQYVLYPSSDHSKGKTNMSKGKEPRTDEICFDEGRCGETKCVYLLELGEHVLMSLPPNYHGTGCQAIAAGWRWSEASAPWVGGMKGGCTKEGPRGGNWFMFRRGQRLDIKGHCAPVLALSLSPPLLSTALPLQRCWGRMTFTRCALKSQLKLGQLTTWHALINMPFPGAEQLRWQIGSKWGEQLLSGKRHRSSASAQGNLAGLAPNLTPHPEGPLPSYTDLGGSFEETFAGKRAPTSTQCHLHKMRGGQIMAR